jgi:GYF domain 2
MIGAWSINVSGRVYGPFTSDRMRSFVGEGRLAPHSLVAREGSTDWHEAREEPEFSDVFAQRGQPAPATAASAPKPEPAPQPAHVTPSPQPNPAPAPRSPQMNTPQVPTSHAPAATPGDHMAAHFAVILDQKAQSAASNIETAIGSLGQFYRLTNNVWIISTEQSVSAVRNRLVQELGKADSLFVIDASRGKAAWFNFGPEADVRIRRVWQKSA